MNTRKILSLNVRRLRLDKRWTQQKLADKADVARIIISQIEADRDTANPVLETLIKIANALEVNTWQLLCPAGQIDN